MGTKKRKSRKHHSRGSKLHSKLFAILSGKSHRVVARSSKLGAARRKARSLIKRGSKHVSIRRGSKHFAVGRTSKRTSRKRHSKRRASRRRVSRNGRRRRRVSRNKHRRSKRHSR